MPQSINLYSASLCQHRQSAALGRLLLLQGGLVAAVLVAGASLQWHARQLQHDTLQTVAQTDARRGGLTQAVTSSTDQSLRSQLQRLRDHEAAAQRLQGLLVNGSAGRQEGYSADLEALARQAHPAVWITGLRLQGGDDGLELRGRMTDPALLPDYLRRLQSEPRFRGRTFSTLQIRRRGITATSASGAYPERPMPSVLPDTPDTPDYSEFTLSTQSPAFTPAAPAAAALRQP